MESHELVEEPHNLHLCTGLKEKWGPLDHQIFCSPGGHASCLCVSPGCCWQGVLRALSSQWAPQTGSSKPTQVSVLPLSHPSPISPWLALRSPVV